MNRGSLLTDSRMTCGASTGANHVPRLSPHGLTYHLEERAAPSGPFACSAACCLSAIPSQVPSSLAGDREGCSAEHEGAPAQRVAPE